jgi:hypothetical protein
MVAGSTPATGTIFHFTTLAAAPLTQQSGFKSARKNKKRGFCFFLTFLLPHFVRILVFVFWSELSPLGAPFYGLNCRHCFVVLQSSLCRNAGGDCDFYFCAFAFTLAIKFDCAAYGVQSIGAPMQTKATRFIFAGRETTFK